MHIRPARAEDARGMSLVLEEIIARWESQRPTNPDHVLRFYVEHPDKIQCLVAAGDNGAILGFQSLKLASDANPYGVSPGWGIIGTYVAGDCAGRGVGRKLFTSMREAANASGITRIDATIDKTNRIGLAYYDVMGFKTYKTTPGAVCKCYSLA